MYERKILTLEDLYAFYYSTSKRNRHYSAEDEAKNIVVQVPGNIIFEKDDNATEGLTSVVLQACHTGINLNGSSIADDVAEKALPSFANRPILGYIHTVNGQDEFYDHRMHTEGDEIVYDERPIGIVPESSNAHLEYDEEKDKTYVVVNGYIFDEYSKATQILQREGECSCSVELAIRELSFDAKKKVLNIEDYYYTGVTILGKTPDGEEVRPGMAGANIKISDFTKKSIFSQDKMIAVLNEINEKLDQLTINSTGKEENQMDFEENVEVTETAEEETVVEEATATEEVVEETATEESTDETDATEAQTEETNDEAPSEEEKFSKTFEISHEDIRCALYALIAPYEEQDNDWYGISAVYDDHFIYEGWFNESNKFRQNYKKDGDDVVLDGERVHVNVEYLTDSELASLNEMRSNYAAVSDELAKFKAEPEKMSVLNSDEYSSIADSDEFVAFKKQDAHFDMSVEEVRSKADEMLLNAAKTGNVNFKVADEKSGISMLPLPMNSKATKTGRYGSLFSKN